MPNKGSYTVIPHDMENLIGCSTTYMPPVPQLQLNLPDPRSRMLVASPKLVGGSLHLLDEELLRCRSAHLRTQGRFAGSSFRRPSCAPSQLLGVLGSVGLGHLPRFLRRDVPTSIVELATPAAVGIPCMLSTGVPELRGAWRCGRSHIRISAPCPPHSADCTTWIARALEWLGNVTVFDKPRPSCLQATSRL